MNAHIKTITDGKTNRVFFIEKKICTKIEYGISFGYATSLVQKWWDIFILL